MTTTSTATQAKTTESAARINRSTTTAITSSAPTSSPSTIGDASSNPTPKRPGIVDNCDKFYQVSSGDICDSITKSYGISKTQFRKWNTEINEDCTNLWVNYYVCVHIPGTATTPTGNASGPTPQLPGIVNNCKSYHLITSGDTCKSIYTEAGVTLAHLRKWNTQLNEDCSNLWLDYYICVGV